MDARSRAEQALAQDGMTFEDFEATVFVGVEDMILSDSDTLEDSKETFKRALAYGEDAWLYEWKGEEVEYAKDRTLGDAEFVDVSDPDDIEVDIRSDGSVIWVSVNGITQFRACRIKNLRITDRRAGS